MTRSLSISAAVAALVLAACSAGSLPPPTTAPDPSDTNPSPSTLTEVALPVDPAIAAVSKVSPGADAAAALGLCNFGEDGLPLSLIAGMGYITTASRVPQYVRVTGNEPELKSTAGAWVIQVSGEVPQLNYQREVWIDPICVVIDGLPGWYATGSRRLASGKLLPPAEFESQQTYLLPPLAP